MYLSFILPTLQDYNYNKPLLDLTKTKILCAFEVIIVCNNQDNAIDFQKNLASDPRFKVFSCNNDNILELIKLGRLKATGDTSSVIQKVEDLKAVNLETEVRVIEKEVPVEKVKVVEVIKEVPVEKIVQVEKEVIVEKTKVVETVKEVPVEKVKIVETKVPVEKVKIIEKEVPVEKIKIVEKEIPVEKVKIIEKEATPKVEKPSFSIKISSEKETPKKTNTFRLVRDTSTPPVPKSDIDFVFPYVTSDDSTWQEAYKKALIKNGADEESWRAGIERFRDSGTFKYFFRALDKFCPWINQVHMIVMSESQVPKWLNTKYIHIITHDQFMPKNMLPTFNSSTIEMFLYNLPEVSNKFIYANDDTIFTRPLEPSFFFDGGKPVYQLILRDFREIAPGDKMRRNDYNLYFGTNQTKRVVSTQHGPIALKKKWIGECYKRFEKEMLASCTPFRTDTDLNQYLYALYQMMEKQIVNTQRAYKTYEVKDAQLSKILSEDFSKIDEICINDSKESTPEQWRQVIEKLDKLLPNKCKYEL